MLPKELLEAYKNEDFANEAYKEFRLREGIVCKKCASTQHYWLASKQQFQCKSCKFRTTLRSGTILEGSKLPISYFFIAIHLLMRNNNKLTLEEFRANTEHKYYEPLWDFIRKMKEYIKDNQQSMILLNFVEVVNEVLFRQQKQHQEH